MVGCLGLTSSSVLEHVGKISADEMKQIAHERYDAFDAHRRRAEALVADAEDIKVLEEIEKRGDA